MVWLARWIRDPNNIPNSRVLIITDRTELDAQIQQVFQNAGEKIYRTKSGRDLISALNENEHWFICSLIHKFGNDYKTDYDGYIDEIQSKLPDNFKAKGDIFVFIDECHRTQSGKLHKALKKLLPDATLIGFTGTPLLKKDKRKSIEIFGPYIHTYKFDEAVRDGIVLDLRYEARDIDQYISNQAKIDQWFERTTRGLTEYGKTELKKRWGTLKKVLSTNDRLDIIVRDILTDMGKPGRLNSGQGNAMLVAGDIYSACRFYEKFSRIGYEDKCAVITSYSPYISDIKGEMSGAGDTENIFKYKTYRKMLADFFDEPEDKAINRVEEFEIEVKKRFIEQPANMKLLIVVEKLLTGFDAPPATYLYIDKSLRDHGLFQAICRVNRLDGDSKEYGYIIDYKDLFKSLEKSINDYTGEAFEDYDSEDVKGLLKDRLKKGKERLEEVRESLKALCEPVEPPKGTTEHQRYFCGTSDNPESLKETEPRRLSLYKLTSSFIRAYANIADEMEEAGYNKKQTQEIKKDVEFYEKLVQEVRITSGETIDLKKFEPDMRYMLDAYVRSNESEVITDFDNKTLVDLILLDGEEATKKLPKEMQKSEEAMAEAIENNVRKVIIDEMAVNPAYYEKMSVLLDELIKSRKEKAKSYRKYLKEIIELANKCKNPGLNADKYPKKLKNAPQRAFYDNLKNFQVLGSDGQDEPISQEERVSFAMRLDKEIRNNLQDNWHTNEMKIRMVKQGISNVVGNDDEIIEQIIEIARNQNEYKN